MSVLGDKVVMVFEVLGFLRLKDRWGFQLVLKDIHRLVNIVLLVVVREWRFLCLKLLVLKS